MLNKLIKGILLASGTLAAGTAMAQLDPTSTTNGGSDLFLVVYNSTANSAYIDDLGVSVNTLANITAAGQAQTGAAAAIAAGGTSNLTVSSLPGLSTFLSGVNTAAITWSVIGGYQPTSTTQEYVTTSGKATSLVYSPGTYITNQVTNNNLTAGYSGFVYTLQGVASTGYAGGAAGTNASGGTLFTQLTTANNQDVRSWEGSGAIIQGTSFLNTVKTGSTSNLYVLATNSTGSINPANLWSLGSLAFSTANDSLTFTANTTGVSLAAPAVPLPASAWLLGSSLLGLVGVTRRRRATV